MYFLRDKIQVQHVCQPLTQNKSQTKLYMSPYYDEVQNKYATGKMECVPKIFHLGDDH